MISKPSSVRIGRRLRTWEGRGPDRLWLLVSLALLGSLGCMAERDSFIRAAVEGTVTLDGKPLDHATIRFVPFESTTGPKTTLTIVSGQFKADHENGPAVGMHRVEIELTAHEFAHDDEEAWKQLSSQRQPIGQSQVYRRQLPAIYNESSTLTATIVPFQNQSLEFSLTSR